MNEEQKVFVGGALPSPEEELKTAWTLASAGAPTVYPKSCFIEQEHLNVSYQAQIGACVGCTGEEVVRNIVYMVALKERGAGLQEELSWRFVYALAKCLEGVNHPVFGDYRIYSRTKGANDGTYPALVAKLIRKVGVPLAKYCPNDTSLSADDFCYQRDIKNIPQEAFEDAKKRRSGADFTVPVTEDGIKRAITYAKANNGGVMILRRIGDTYWKDKDGNSTWDKNRLLPIRPPKSIESGHEEYLYGYDEEEGTGRVRIYWLNHWSKAWADNGRAWEYLDEWLPFIGEIRVCVASVPVTDNFRYTFTKTLKYGDKGPDVVALQHVLKLEGLFPKDQPFTGYFGDMTFRAVCEFQKRYANSILAFLGLTKPTGVVARQTIKKLNELYGA